MNIDPGHLSALKALGYTEAEARFLYIVATHSGYFVARQFLAFTAAHWGYRTNTFADLEGAPSLVPKHLSEAIQYRTLDRTYWA